MALFGYPRAQENDAERAARGASDPAGARRVERAQRALGRAREPRWKEAKIGQIGGFTSFYWLLSKC